MVPPLIVVGGIVAGSLIAGYTVKKVTDIPDKIIDKSDEQIEETRNIIVDLVYDVGSNLKSGIRVGFFGLLFTVGIVFMILIILLILMLLILINFSFKFNDLIWEKLEV